MHVSNLFTNAPMVRLAERLVGAVARRERVLRQLRRGGQRGRAQARSQGAAAGRRRDVHGAFHGRTYGALSATPQESKQAPFAPLVPGFRAVAATAEAIAEAVDERTAAVLLEPVQGESGVHPLAAEVLAAAREACDRVGAALVFDEVQCGVGRTGSLWAYEQAGVVPDAMTLAKGLGGGMPVGALVIGPALAGVFEPGDHGSTFAGGPVARRRPTPCSTSSTTRTSSPACSSAASGSPRG